MIKAVIFDMDGTVFDTEKAYRRGWVRAGKLLGISIDLLAELPNITGRNHINTALYFKNKYGEAFPFEELYRTMWACADEELEDQIPSCPGVPQVFEDLQAQGCKLALASSSSKERVYRYLNKSGYAHYFDVVITGERVSNGKPAPDIFLLTAKELEVAPQNCVVVEDARTGVLGGVNAGMRTVMVPEYQPCTEDLQKVIWHRLDTLESFAALVAQNNRAK